jgi:cytochrome c-type biogenesis protein CcmF
MIANAMLGRVLVLVAVAAACYGTVVAFAAGRKHSLVGLRRAEQATYLFGAAMFCANLTMVRALLAHDFSVSYVAQVGSRSTPTWVTVVSLWSSLEGSILFWGLIVGGYACAFAWLLRRQAEDMMPYALGTVLFVAAFFAFLIAGPANPFLPVDPVPADGPGPNPLLQNHVLMVIHPPMLYLGYVGMTVPFAIAVAALMRADLRPAWLRTLRRWTMVPWTFLSIGIVLGGWWAYEVLGWGGYWAWDPVENASFMPWLAATAYLHATLVQERRRILKAWTLALVLAAFLLTILGTFMTRSGVFNSVHSFTQSSIGPIFLGFLAVLVIGSLVLLAGRSHLLEPEGRVRSPWAREAAFVVNNAIFAVFTFTVLLGTVFPLVVEAVQGAKMSVGEPYFNSMAVPIGLALVFLMGVGPALPWGEPRPQVVLRSLAAPAAFGAAVATVAALWLQRGTIAIVTFGLCAFAAWVNVRELLAPAWAAVRRQRAPAWRIVAEAFAGNRRRLGGYLVHLAVLLIAASIAASQTYRISTEASLRPGEHVVLGDYTFTFEGTRAEEQAHRFSLGARLHVAGADGPLGVLEPRLNYYPSQREPVGTPHVQSFIGHDLYASLLSAERDGSRVAVKLYVIPMVPWLWWSLPVLALGSLIGLLPRRRRILVPEGVVAT